MRMTWRAAVPCRPPEIQPIRNTAAGQMWCRFRHAACCGMSHTSMSWAQATHSFRVGESRWVKNAGLIEIDWDARTVELSAINPDGEKILNHSLKLSELTFK
jgi:hypothetical protein